MKIAKLILIALVAAACAMPSEARKSKAVKFEISSGTNIAHWLSQSGAHGPQREAFFSEADVERIAAWGFDHIRLPIDEEQMFRDDGTKDEEAFSLLHNAIRWSLRHKLRVVVDLHILRSHNFDARVRPLFSDPAAASHFCDVWRALSGELRKYPVTKVAYELMNEPVADDPAQWNRVATQCYRAVRELEPRRIIIIGSNKWQSFETMKDLAVPSGDANIILSYHYYLPMGLTHYTASWTGLKRYHGRVHYPGRLVAPDELAQQPADIQKEYSWLTGVYHDRQRIKADMMQAVGVARKCGLRIYCGEFGCLDRAPRADRLRWYRDMVSVLEELGVPHANWCYKEDGFGLIHTDGKTTDNDVREILTGKRQ